MILENSKETSYDDMKYEYKKDHIVKIANKSKGKIPDYVYNAMLAWDVQKQCA